MRLERQDSSPTMPSEADHEQRLGEYANAPSDAQIRAAVDALDLVADPTRLRLLWVLGRGEEDVGTLARLVEASVTATSQHLSKLRLAGMVESRRDGRRVIYRIPGVHVRRLVEEALYYADHRVSGIPDHE
jgi:DNA-binding transcriptional ArsR family regulator